MADQAGHPERINLLEVAKRVTGDYANFIVARANDHVLRMSVMTGAFHWHKHPDSDELFIRTRAGGRTVNLTIEHEGTSPGGETDGGRSG